VITDNVDRVSLRVAVERQLRTRSSASSMATERDACFQLERKTIDRYRGILVNLNHCSPRRGVDLGFELRPV
jgi:hypothetical protein